MTRRQLITTPRMGTRQHASPCSDCPWARFALPGWLGMLSPAEWVQVAHSDDRVECHTVSNMQCAGIAMYRANVAKAPRDPRVLRLPPDRATCFATPAEFLEYHKL